MPVSHVAAALVKSCLAAQFPPICNLLHPVSTAWKDVLSALSLPLHPDPNWMRGEFSSPNIWKKIEAAHQIDLFPPCPNPLENFSKLNFTILEFVLVDHCHDPTSGAVDKRTSETKITKIAYFTCVFFFLVIANI